MRAWSPRSLALVLALWGAREASAARCVSSTSPLQPVPLPPPNGCDAGFVCQNGQCVPGCDFTNCGGCCDGNGACQPGDQQQACGASGVPCQSCVIGCSDAGFCVGAVCGPLCQGGCCAGTVCIQATAQSNAQCGYYGGMCTACTLPTTCVTTDAGGLCLPPFDGGAPDAGAMDAGSGDAGTPDAGPADSGPTNTDAGPPAGNDAGGCSGSTCGTVRTPLIGDLGCHCGGAGAGAGMGLAALALVLARRRRPPTRR